MPETTPPVVHPLECKWSWYAHMDGGGAYGSSVARLGSFDSVNDFWRYHHHVPAPGTVFCGERALQLPQMFGRGCVASGFAVFREGVYPAWEDPRNAKGCDLCARGSHTPDGLNEMWRDLLLALISEQLGSNVVGVRLAHKRDRRTSVVWHKFEVWCDDLATAQVLRELEIRFPALAFTIVPHAEMTASRGGRHAHRASSRAQRPDGRRSLE